MAFEYRSDVGLIRLVRAGRRWRVELGGDLVGSWPGPEQAAAALATRSSGYSVLDGAGTPFVPGQLADWTPTGENL